MTYNDYFSYENNIKMVDLIIKSTNDLVPLVIKHSDLDNTISETISLIFKFLRKILKALPDVLVSENHYNYVKDETMESFNDVMASWEDFRSNPHDFQMAWDDFYFWWEKMNKDLLDIQRSSHTVFLSMN